MIHIYLLCIIHCVLCTCTGDGDEEGNRYSGGYTWKNTGPHEQGKPRSLCKYSASSITVLMCKYGCTCIYYATSGTVLLLSSSLVPLSPPLCALECIGIVVYDL